MATGDALAAPVAVIHWRPNPERVEHGQGREFNPFRAGIHRFVDHEFRSGTSVPSLHPWLFILIPSGDRGDITNTLAYL